MDSSAIKEINSQVAINAANARINELDLDFKAIALPKDFELRSLEQFNDCRNQFRAHYKSDHLQSYVEYVKSMSEGTFTKCFIESGSMSAVTIFDIGTYGAPGHAVNSACLKLEKTAQFKALDEANNKQFNQKDFAEFFEEWRDSLSFYTGTDPIKTPAAIAKLRSVTIETARKVDHAVENFKASVSTMESIEAKSADGQPPEGFIFTCAPYTGIAPISFMCRISVLTGGDKVAFKFKIQRIEELREQMANSFLEKLADSFDVTDVEIYIGTYDSK